MPLIVTVTLVDCRDDTWIGVTPDYYISGAEVWCKRIFVKYTSRSMIVVVAPSTALPKDMNKKRHDF